MRMYHVQTGHVTLTFVLAVETNRVCESEECCNGVAKKLMRTFARYA